MSLWTRFMWFKWGPETGFLNTVMNIRTP